MVAFRVDIYFVMLDCLLSLFFLIFLGLCGITCHHSGVVITSHEFICRSYYITHFDYGLLLHFTTVI